MVFDKNSRKLFDKFLSNLRVCSRRIHIKDNFYAVYVFEKPSYKPLCVIYDKDNNFDEYLWIKYFVDDNYLEVHANYREQ